MTSLVEFMNESLKDELNNVNEHSINEGEIKDEKLKNNKNTSKETQH